MIGRICFVDAWAFVALANDRDQWHDLARSANAELQARRARLVTTNVVVGETLTQLRRTMGHSRAVTFGEWLQRVMAPGGEFEVVWITAELHRAAWELFRRYDDKDFSFVDCLSFAVMRERGIRVAFTGDRHFRQMGFITVPELDTEQAP
jgi:predicted nucleic acid-binding protein